MRSFSLISSCIVAFLLLVLVNESRGNSGNSANKTAPQNQYLYSYESVRKSSYTTIRRSSGAQDIFTTRHTKSKVEVKTHGPNSGASDQGKGKEKMGDTEQVSSSLPEFLLQQSTHEENETSHNSGPLSYLTRRVNHQLVEETGSHNSSLKENIYIQRKVHRFSTLQNVSTLFDHRSQAGVIQAFFKRDFNNESSTEENGNQDSEIDGKALVPNNGYKIISSQAKLEVMEPHSETETVFTDDSLDSVFKQIEENTGRIDEGIGAALKAGIETMKQDERKSSTSWTRQETKRWSFDFAGHHEKKRE